MKPNDENRVVMRGSAGRGFTLIEVLVVVTIIGVLIAILLPAIGRARDSAVGVRCAANLRQIGLLTPIYQQERRGYVIPGNVGSAGQSVAWQHFLSVEYMGGGPGIFLCPAIRPSEGNKTGYFKPAKNSTTIPFDKPEYDLMQSASYVMNLMVPHTSNTWTGATTTWSGAGMLQTLGYDARVIRGWTGAPAGSGSNAKNFAIRETVVNRPSGAIFITDHRPDHFDGSTNNASNMTNAFLDGVYEFPTTDWGTNYGTNASAGTPRVKVGSRLHLEAFNALYGDGRVVTIKASDKSDPESWIASNR